MEFTYSAGLEPDSETPTKGLNENMSWHFGGDVLPPEFKD